MTIYLTVLATLVTLSLISINNALIKIWIEMKKMNNVNSFFSKFKS